MALVLLSPKKPIWRGDPMGRWPLVFTAVANCYRLDAAAAPAI
jgi:hypothetical protein